MDLPVITFIQDRLSEADTTLETRPNTAFYDLFIKPQELMLQPLLTAMVNALIGQSVASILAQPTPDTFDSGAVDNLTSNLYVDRFQGSFAETTARVFYADPTDVEFTAGTAEFLTNAGFSYFNINDISITAAQMTLNISSDLYYVDVPIIAQNPGTDYAVAIGGIITFLSDANAISVTNAAASIGGLPTETNTAVLTRTGNSIAVRDLETEKGINAIINQQFPGTFSQIQSIGMGDPEMQRDIIFNTHVGSKTDVYLKTPALQTNSANFIGIDFDFNREFPINIRKQITAGSFSDPEASLGYINVEVGSLTVFNDVVETPATITSASITPVTGINLSAHEWITLQLDNNLPLPIKVSGATPSSTQRFEIINSINAALGQTIAVANSTTFITLTSQTVGAISRLEFTTPTGGKTDATAILFPSVNTPPHNYNISGDETFQGAIATQYYETIDYAVDYLNGLIIKLPGSAILSGSTIVGPAVNGDIATHSNIFSSPTPGAFSLVEPGDYLNITASTGITPGQYVVSEVIDVQTLKILNFSPSSDDSAVQYNIVSNQVLSINFSFNPLTVDVGPLVLQADGLTRGIRPGRDLFTITDVPFIGIISIQEIDPDTQEGLGVFLNPIGGFGSGGFGEGGYGSGQGDYAFVVNSPTERFSVFEDSTILFNQSLFGNSYQITYYYAPEILPVHNFARNDGDRVTGADVLPKNFVPGFVDMTINIKRKASNSSTPDNPTLAVSVSSYINAIVPNSPDGVDASQITTLLENQGVDAVEEPFTMTMTTLNTDGSSTIIVSEYELIFPAVVLPSATPNFVTSRLVQPYSRNIVINTIT